MKSLITKSFRLLKALHSSSYLPSSGNQLFKNGFGTAKQTSATIPIIALSQEKLQPKGLQALSIQQRQSQIMSANRYQLQRQAVKLINSYITIDEIKCHPGQIRQLLLIFTKVLQYDRDDRGRQFYLSHKTYIQKIIYDLRCYNAESQMTNQEIILTYYFCKLLRDYGYQQAPTGFELRSSIKLAKHLATGQLQSGTDYLSFDQAVYARWLMAKNGFSSHEFNWKTHRLFVDSIVSWINLNPYDRKKFKRIVNTQYPLKLHHICAMLSSFYYQEIHLATDYRTAEFMIKNLHQNQQQPISYENLMKNQNIYIEIFTSLIGLKLQFFSSQNMHHVRNVMKQIVAAIEQRLLGWLVKQDDVKWAFVNSSSLDIFLASDSYQKYQILIKANNQENKLLQNFSNLDLYRYFVLLNEISENESFFQIIEPQYYQKLMFILNEIFHEYFSPIINLKESAINGQILSIYTRFKVIMIEKELNKLRKNNDIIDQKKEPKKLKEKVEKVIKNYKDLIQTVIEKSSLLDLAIKRQKKPYLNEEEKEVLREKRSQLKKMERNIVSPIVDFLYGLRKYTLDQQKLFQPSRVINMIDQLQPLLKKWFNDSPAQHPSSLSFQNKYFWLLKFLNLSYTTTTDNKFYLKQFQSLLLQHVVKNSLKAEPQKFYTVSVYNLYAYMCQLQQKMMENQRIGNGINKQEGVRFKGQKDIVSQVQKGTISKTQNGTGPMGQKATESMGQENKQEGFYDKKEYKYFLAYKEYLSKLIFDKNFDIGQNQTQQTSDLQIPNKLRIDPLFKNCHPDQQTDQPYLQTFRLPEFFQTIFRENRFSNHKLLSQQFLIKFFGNNQLFTQNSNQLIHKKKHRSSQNFREIIYILLLAGDRNVTNVKNVWDLPTIKQKTFLAMTEKSVGSLVLNMIREVAAPRKSSFFKRTPLKYRLNTFSLFETVRFESAKRKKQVMTNLLHVYFPDKTILFGFLEILLFNLDLWNPQQKSQMIWGVIIPYLLNRFQQKYETSEVGFEWYLNLGIRMPRRCQVIIKPENQHVFLQFLSNQFPNIFENMTRKNNQKHKYVQAYGYLIDIEYIYKLNHLELKNLIPILEKCHEILLKKITDSPKNSIPDDKYYNKMYNQLCDLLLQSRLNKKPFSPYGQNVLQYQQNKTAISSAKLFYPSRKKSTNPQTPKMQTEKKVVPLDQEIPYHKQKIKSKLFKRSQKKSEVQNRQKSTKGIISKKE